MLSWSIIRISFELRGFEQTDTDLSGETVLKTVPDDFVFLVWIYSDMEFADVDVSVPRNRKGEFEPQVLKKNQTSIAVRTLRRRSCLCMPRV